MERVSAAIVDDDLLARRAISRVMQNDERIEVVDTRGDIGEIVSWIDEVKPGVLLFDIGEPHSEKFSAFLNLRAYRSDLPIVVLATRSEAGAEATIAALKMGAVDVITKPEACAGLLFAGNHLSKRVVPIVLNASATHRLSDEAVPQPDIQPLIDRVWLQRRIRAIRQKPDIIVIGSGSGGPRALFELIPALPETLTLPVVIAQHFPRAYTKVLARELNRHSDIEVREAVDGVELIPGMVWLAKGGYQCEVHRAGSHHTMLRIHKGPREQGNRPSITTLFRSAIRVCGGSTLGILLSGCGRDGEEGARLIAESGGQLLIPHPDLALGVSIPFTPIRDDLADHYENVRELAQEIERRTTVSSDTSSASLWTRKQSRTSAWRSRELN